MFGYDVLFERVPVDRRSRSEVTEAALVRHRVTDVALGVDLQLCGSIKPSASRDMNFH